MITLEDYKHLLEHFEVVRVPANLENFVEKIKVMYEELCYREEVQKKITELHDRLNKLSNKDIKEN